MAKRAKSKPSREAGPAVASAAVLLSPATPADSAYGSNYTSEDEEVEAAKFDVSTIPIRRLTLHDDVPEASPKMGRRSKGKAVARALPDKERAAEKDKAKEATDDPPKKPTKPFLFLQLPSELRVRIYGYHFQGVDLVLDLTPDNYRKIHRKLALLRTCRHIYAEASHFFYSRHVFRIFPTYPGRFFKTRRPLLARLFANQRADLTALELRLGPGFDKPPKCWDVTPNLGLPECFNVRRLHVFVQLDPSLSWLDGYRRPGFYESFSRGLLDGILKETPGIEVVEFDGYESVRKSSPIMQVLVQTAQDYGKKIAWGPRNGWSETEDCGGDDKQSAVATTTLLDPAGALLAAA